MTDSPVRRGLDALLARYPGLDVIRVEWQIDPGDERHARRWGGPWVLVDLGQPSAAIEVAPAWAVWRFAIWRSTGAVYSVDHTGAVGEDPILPGEARA